MNTRRLLLVVGLGVAGCSDARKRALEAPVPEASRAEPPSAFVPEHEGFSAIEPIDADLYWAGDAVMGYEDLDGDGVAGNTNLERLSAFPVEAAHVQVVRVSGQGEIDAPIVSASVSGEQYLVILDYVKYRTDETTEGCLVQTGVGIRMKARLELLESAGHISTPFGLAAAASAGKVRGDLMFQTIGVHGKAVSPLVPLPSKLSEESIQAGIVAVGAIKASLYTDGDVLIRPQVFGHAPEDKCREPGSATSAFARPPASG